MFAVCTAPVFSAFPDPNSSKFHVSHGVQRLPRRQFQWESVEDLLLTADDAFGYVEKDGLAH
jgi:hypothetical protein